MSTETPTGGPITEQPVTAEPITTGPSTVGPSTAGTSSLEPSSAIPTGLMSAFMWGYAVELYFLLFQYTFTCIYMHFYAFIQVVLSLVLNFAFILFNFLIFSAIPLAFTFPVPSLSPCMSYSANLIVLFFVFRIFEHELLLK